MKTLLRWLLPALLLVLSLSGCGGPLVKVSGTVTYKGQPVPSTMVVFHPETEGKRDSRGYTDDHGHFELHYSTSETGAEKGKYTVTLKYHMTADEETHKIEPKATKELKAIIAKFGDPKTSPLHYEITGSGPINIELPDQ